MTDRRQQSPTNSDWDDWVALASDRIWEMNADLRFVKITETAIKETPAIVAALLGRTRWELAGVHPGQDEAMDRHQRELEAHRPFTDFRYARPMHGGPSQHWRISGYPLFNTNGDFIGYRGTAIDETDLVNALQRSARAERVLKERDAQFQHAVEVANLGYYTWDGIDKTYLSVSETFLRLHGVSDPYEFIGHDFKETGDDYRFIHPHDLVDYQAQIALADGHDAGFDVDYRIKTADGAVRHIRERGDPVIDAASGRLLRTFGTLQDITDVKRAEASLLQEQKALQGQVRASEEQLRWFLDQTQAIVFIKDTAGRYKLINNRFESVFGLLRDETIGKQDSELFPQELAQKFRQDDALVIEHGLSMEFEDPVPACNGPHTYFSVKFPIYDAEETLQGIGGISTDITERKRTEAERETLVEELENKNAELERFTYTVSHDLKSPLITIRGFVGMLRQDLEKTRHDQIRHDLDHIDDAAKHMQGLLAQLLELCRTSRQLTEPSNVEIREVVRRVMELMQTSLVSTAIQVGPLPTVWGDEARLVEVFQNLLENAVKFTSPQASPKIEIGQREGVEPVIFVRDNGIGVDKRYLTKLFELFEVLDPQIEGSGVGLALVKRIVEAHGGRVWAESDGLGQGTTICLVLGEVNRSQPRP